MFVTLDRVGEQIALLARRGCVEMAGNLNDVAVKQGWIDQATHSGLKAHLCGFQKRQLPADHRVFGVFLNSVISSLHFETQTDRAFAREAFRQAVRWVEIETSSQCNRRCSYCPNSKFDRITSSGFLDMEVYKKMMRELAEIDYDGDIKFVGNNEFFMHKENRAYVEYARVQLPNAKLTLFSNGDYLKKEDLEWASSVSVGLLIVTLHTAPNKQYDDVEVMRRSYQFQQQIAVPLQLRHFKKGVDLRFIAGVGKTTVLVGHSDLSKLGHNWTSLLPGHEGHVRSDPCTYPIRQFTVNYLGDIFMCCIAFKDRTAENEKTGAITGNLVGYDSVFQAYTSPGLTAWRRSLFHTKVKEDPCKTCSGHAHYVENHSRPLADFVCQQIPGLLTPAASTAQTRRVALPVSGG